MIEQLGQVYVTGNSGEGHLSEQMVKSTKSAYTRNTEFRIPSPKVHSSEIVARTCSFRWLFHVIAENPHIIFFAGFRSCTLVRIARA